LHCASELGNLATVRWLIEKGADINAVDENGHTPRDLAEHEAIEKHLAAIGALTKSEISPTLAPPEPQMTYSEKREITDLIDRLELLEDKCGIRVEAVYATCEGSIVNGVGEYSLEVNCDIVGTGATLERSFHLRLNAYNPAGQLIKTGTDFISAGDFSGFQSCSIRLYCDHFPHRLRLFPS
jgi:hypothetical protein